MTKSCAHHEALFLEPEFQMPNATERECTIVYLFVTAACTLYSSIAAGDSHMSQFSKGAEYEAFNRIPP